MDTFLGKTAKHIIKNHPEGLDNVCIVLPSKRSSLFLKKHLSNEIQQNIWSPSIYSIEDFVKELSNVEILDNISLLFELFEVHKTIAKQKHQSFEEFIKWGQVLLHDFNEIEMNLASAKEIFNYLSDIKSLINWNPEQKEPTEFQKQYIKFFNSLYDYYSLLNKNLGKRNASFIGHAYRKIADQTKEISITLKWSKIYFAGFNALTKAEEKIIFDLKVAGKAELLWDADNFYLEKNKNGIYHEAGLFIRKHFKRSSQNKWAENGFKEDEKKIFIYGVPKQVGQAKFCGQLINQLPEFVNEGYRSALVLADENLLFPILNSMPGIDKLNATMGIPLNTSPAFDFVNTVLELQIHAEINKKNNQSERKVFHINDISKVIHHPLLKDIIEELYETSSNTHTSLLKKLEESNQVYYMPETLQTIFSGSEKSATIFDQLFSPWDSAEPALEHLKQILISVKEAYLVKQQLKGFNQKIELEYIFQLSVILNKLLNYQDKYRAITSLKSLSLLFNQICKTEKLALFGQPLEGMQLMGMLETRNLDFKNLILCSANENILPSSSKHNSFIPFDIKREFDLPTYKEKNAIFAYHFYRLLQRAKNIHILYNTEVDPLAGGDKSRFLYQIIEELPAYNPKLKIHERIVESKIRIPKSKNIVVKKTDSIMNEIHKKAITGFSPTALSSFIRCSLQFYFKEIAQISDYKQTEETMDAATLGQVIHDALQQIYTPFIDELISVEQLQRQLKKLSFILKNSFEKYYTKGNIKYGKNFLITKIAHQYIKKFIDAEISDIKNGAQIIIKSLENKYTKQLRLKNIKDSVSLKGYIDRLDLKDGQIRVIDYKTGAVKKRDLKINDWGSLVSDPNKDKCFQLMFYVILLNKQLVNKKKILPGIYSLKNISQRFIHLQIPQEEYLNDELINEFEENIREIINAIYDTDKQFSQTNNLDICNLCDFKTICNRN